MNTDKKVWVTLPPKGNHILTGGNISCEMSFESPQQGNCNRDPTTLILQKIIKAKVYHNFGLTL